MIRKLLFTSAFFTAFIFSKAQVQVWQDNFNDLDISDWTLYDQDGDGNDWDVAQLTSGGAPSGTPILTSVSWNGAPLTPDNWVVSPAVDLTNASGAITLKWSVFASDPEYNLENYGVYVATENSVEALTTAGELFTEFDLPSTLTERTLDLSAFAGQTIYIAFRHYDVSDQFRIGIDNVSVEAATLAVSEASKTKVSVYPNPTSDVLNIKSLENVKSVEIFDLTGKKANIVILNNGVVDVRNLAKGAYILKVNSDNGSTSHKFIKK
ncbi:T9SS-dependent choice-of-anchor J family protein [Empedobacter sp. UBA7620]|uniref:T9SS-dependent choice-of-anchor J family protein n=1 Tax=Empedobacter sp. UBA7620 TaxID=1946452 RepID=UPI0025C6837D|nr:choice-of-anchor J domain-containing protein [Empedobacter sp. UBA7620]